MAKRAGYKVVGLPNYVVWHIDTEEKVSTSTSCPNRSRCESEIEIEKLTRSQPGNA
jgi:hypothetical protein